MKLIILLLLLTTDVYGECRSAATVKKFNQLHGNRVNPKGYVVDHICPLSVGGLDAIGNMQYQTIAEGKLKDKWELLPSKKSSLCNSTNSLPYRTVFNCKD